MEYFFDIFLTLWQSFWSQFLGFFVIILQLKKSHFHTSNIHSVETFVG